MTGKENRITHFGWHTEKSEVAWCASSRGWSPNFSHKWIHAHTNSPIPILSQIQTLLNKDKTHIHPRNSLPKSAVHETLTPYSSKPNLKSKLIPCQKLLHCTISNTLPNQNKKFPPKFARRTKFFKTLVDAHHKNHGYHSSEEKKTNSQKDS